MKRTLVLLLVLSFAVGAAAQDLPNAPTPQADSYGFHRTEDVFFGFLISAPVGMATKPWIGLLAGEAAGIANETRYGSHFNVGHLAFISAGALAGYGVAKLSHRVDRHHASLKGGK